MKALFMIFGVFLITIGSLFSQEKRFTIKTGIGYYMDTFTGDDGPIIWTEGGYKVKTGFNLNIRLSMTSIDWIIKEGAFSGYTTLQLRQMADFTFSKPFNIKKSHILEPGLGFKLKREFLLKPDATFIYNSGNTYLSTSYSDVFYEIGVTIYLDYYYQLKSNFYIGIRADTNIIWALGFEGLTLSPVFGFRF